MPFRMLITYEERWEMSFDSQCRLFSDDGTTLSPISVKRPPKNNMPFRCQERFISKKARVLYQKRTASRAQEQ